MDMKRFLKTAKTRTFKQLYSNIDNKIHVNNKYCYCTDMNVFIFCPDFSIDSDKTYTYDAKQFEVLYRLYGLPTEKNGDLGFGDQVLTPFSIDEAPGIPDQDDYPVFIGTIKKADLDWIKLASAVNDIRFYLNSVYFDGKNLVATDGHRLHHIKTEQEHVKPVIIHSSAINLIKNDTDVWLSKNMVSLTEYHDLPILSTQVDAEYPNFNLVMPTRSSFVEVDTADWIAQAEKIRDIMKAKGKWLNAVISDQGPELIPSDTSGLKGTNTIFLIDALKIGKTCSFSLGDAENVNNTSMLFKTENRTAVVMPVRI